MGQNMMGNVYCKGAGPNCCARNIEEFMSYTTQLERIKEIQCTEKKCTGTLYSIPAPRVAEALNLLYLQCDKCGARYAKDVT